MLRISYSFIDSVGRWTLCGQMAGPWVGELRSCWDQARHSGAATRFVLDLSDVTFVDDRGEQLLADMQRAGVEFVASGIETRHLIDNLKCDDERAFRRLV